MIVMLDHQFRPQLVLSALLAGGGKCVMNLDARKIGYMLVLGGDRWDRFASRAGEMVDWRDCDVL